MRVLINRGATLAYTQHSGTAFRLNLSASAAAAVRGASGGTDGPGEEPTTPEKKPDGSGEVIPWGEDNLFPQAVIKDIEKNTILPSLLEKKTSMMYGGGVVYGIVTGVNKDGSKIFEAQEVPEIEEFMELCDVGAFAFEALSDINTFSNAFPELLLSKNRQKIVGVSTQEAPWCRYLKPASGLPTHVVINANWDNGGTATDQYATQVPILDPYYNGVELLRQRTDGWKYIYPISIPSPDKAYYQLASWNAVRRSGWLEVMAAIPEFKKSLFKNQLSVKYLVTIHSAYWEWKYGDWEGLDQDEKIRLINEELAAFDNVMAGTNGAGKTVMSTTIFDKRKNEEVEAFKIEAIDDKLKDGLYIEDSGEASSHVYTAVGVAPSLMGVSPGKAMGDGAGGGSEPRVLFNNFVSSAQFHLDRVLAVLNFIARYNGWTVNGKPVKFRFLNPFVMQPAAKDTPTAPAQQETK